MAIIQIASIGRHMKEKQERVDTDTRGLLMEGQRRQKDLLQNLFYAKESMKQWTQIQKECLCEDTEEWRRLCHKIIYSGGSINGIYISNNSREHKQTCQNIIHYNIRYLRHFCTQLFLIIMKKLIHAEHREVCLQQAF
jgi:hypothetical protein